MPKTRKKVICWNDDTQFEVEFETIKDNKVVTVLGVGGTSVPQPLIGRKYIVKCPVCGSENEVHL